jgi:hypothetical protein
MCSGEGEKLGGPDGESPAGGDPIEEICGLAAGVNDWVCPHCTATVRSHTRPKSSLQLRDLQKKGSGVFLLRRENKGSRDSLFGRFCGQEM